MAKSVMAWRTGLFRCSGIGMTIYARAGEDLPAHDTCEGGCEWEFKKKDNPRREMSNIIVGKEILSIMVLEEVPEINTTLNLKGGGMSGNYRVTKVDKIKLNNNFYARIEVERIGYLQESEHIHPIAFINT